MTKGRRHSLIHAAQVMWDQDLDQVAFVEEGRLGDDAEEFIPHNDALRAAIVKKFEEQ